MPKCDASVVDIGVLVPSGLAETVNTLLGPKGMVIAKSEHEAT